MCLVAQTKEMLQRTEHAAAEAKRDHEAECRKHREQVQSLESANKAVIEEKESVGQQSRQALDRLAALTSQSRQMEQQWEQALQRSQQLSEEKEVAVGLLQREVERLRDERRDLTRDNEAKLATLLQRIESVEHRHSDERADTAQQHDEQLGQVQGELRAEATRVQTVLVAEQQRLKDEVKASEGELRALRDHHQEEQATLYTAIQKHENETHSERNLREADRVRLAAEFEQKEAEIERLRTQLQAFTDRFRKLEESLILEREATAQEREKIQQLQLLDVTREAKTAATSAELHEMAVEREHRMQRLHFLQKELADKSEDLSREKGAVVTANIQIAQLKAQIKSREEAAAATGSQETHREREAKFRIKELEADTIRFQEKISEQSEEQGKLRENITLQDVTIGELHDKLTTSDKEALHIENTVERLQASCNGLVQQLERASANNSAMKESNDELSAKGHEMELAAFATQQEVADSKDTVQEMKTQMEIERKNLSDQMESERKSQLFQIETERQRHMELVESEREDRTEQVTQLQEQADIRVRMVQEELDELRVAKEEVEALAGESTETAHELRAQINAAEQRAATLEARVTAVGAQNARLRRLPRTQPSTPTKSASAKQAPMTSSVRASPAMTQIGQNRDEPPLPPPGFAAASPYGADSYPSYHQAEEAEAPSPAAQPRPEAGVNGQHPQPGADIAAEMQRLSIQVQQANLTAQRAEISASRRREPSGRHTSRARTRPASRRPARSKGGQSDVQQTQPAAAAAPPSSRPNEAYEAEIRVLQMQLNSAESERVALGAQKNLLLSQQNQQSIQLAAMMTQAQHSPPVASQPPMDPGFRQQQSPPAGAGGMWSGAATATSGGRGFDPNGGPSFQQSWGGTPSRRVNGSLPDDAYEPWAGHVSANTSPFREGSIAGGGGPGMGGMQHAGERAGRGTEAPGAGAPQHGLSSNKMALITSGRGQMRSLRIKWP